MMVRFSGDNFLHLLRLREQHISDRRDELFESEIKTAIRRKKREHMNQRTKANVKKKDEKSSECVPLKSVTALDGTVTCRQHNTTTTEKSKEETNGVNQKKQKNA
jgi:hypothetical protein